MSMKFEKVQCDFPKMRGGGKGRLELFRKFIRFDGAPSPRTKKVILPRRKEMIFAEDKDSDITKEKNKCSSVEIWTGPG